jgi:hypothetical protein
MRPALPLRCLPVGVPSLLSALLLAACGEHKPPTQPAQRDDTVVASLALARDSATLEIGDVLTVRADARTAAGAWLPKATITWTSDAESVATVSQGTISAVGPGAAHVVARAGSATAAVAIQVPPRITSVRLQPARDTLVDLNSDVTFAVLATAAGQPREGRYTVVSRAGNLVQAGYSPSRHAVVARALRRGTGVIAVTEAGGASDSVAVVVELPATEVFVPEERIGYVGRTEASGYTAYDANGDVPSSTCLAWRSSDTSVVTVDSAGVYTYRKTGAATVTVTSTAGATARAYVRVDSTPPLTFGADSVTIGVGMFDSVTVSSVVAPVNPRAGLRSTAPTIAEVPDSVVLYDSWVRITARQVGTTLVIASSPGTLPDTLRVRIVPAKVQLQPYFTTNRIPQGPQYVVAVTLADSLGRQHPLAATATVTVTSRNTAVLRVDPPAQLPMYAGVPGAATASIHGVAAGSAWLVATAPGVSADSLRYTVEALPRAAFIPPARRFVIGAGQRSGGDIAMPNLAQLSLGTTDGYSRGTNVTLRIARRHPSVAVVPESLLVPANAVYLPFEVRGLVPGVDTLVATAPGYDPDTLELVVTRLRLLAPFVPAAVTVPDGGWVGIALGDTAGTRHYPAADVPFVVTSSNRSVADPPRPSPMPAGYPGDWDILFGARNTGRAVITIRDSAGLGAPLSVPITVVLDTSLAWRHYATILPFALGFRQRVGGGEYYLGRNKIPEATVRIESSDPGIVTFPSEVTIPSNLDLWSVDPVVAGSRAGTVTVTASAPGYRSTSLTFSVGVPRFKITADDAFRIGARVLIKVHLVDPQGTERMTDEPVTVSLATPDGGAQLDSTTLTIPAGRSYDSTTVVVTGFGQRTIVASDRRGLSYAYLPDTLRTSVPVQQLRLGAAGAGEPVPAIAAALVDSVLLVRTPPLAGALPVTIRCTGSRVVCPGSVTIPAGTEWVYAPLAGLALGADTVAATASGYAGDTARVEVVEARVALEGLPSQMKTGDSVGVRLVLHNRQDRPRPAAALVAFTLAPSGLAVSDGTRAISSISVQAGELASPVFYLRAVAAGPATLSVGNLLFEVLTASSSVTAAPGAGAP